MDGKMTNLISVVVTCYNHEKYIEQCLRSIFKQTYRNIELIVLDDGSTDYSPEIIQEVYHLLLDKSAESAKLPSVAEPLPETAGVTIYSVTSGTGR